MKLANTFVHDAYAEAFRMRYARLVITAMDQFWLDAAGKIVEFEVMIRPFRALEALSSLLSARIGPELAKYKTGAIA